MNLNDGQRKILNYWCRYIGRGDAIRKIIHVLMVLTIMLCIIPGNVYSETSKGNDCESSVVCGYIMDSDTGEPISNASIVVYTDEWNTTSTNESGYYEINVKPGIFHLHTNVAWYVNYADIFNVSDNETLWLNISINELLINEDVYVNINCSSTISLSIICNLTESFNATGIWLSPSITCMNMSTINGSVVYSIYNISFSFLNETEMINLTNYTGNFSITFQEIFTNVSIPVVFNATPAVNYTTVNFTLEMNTTQGTPIWTVMPVYNESAVWTENATVVNMTAVNFTTANITNMSYSLIPEIHDFTQILVIDEGKEMTIYANVTGWLSSIILYYTVNNVEKNTAMNRMNGTTYKATIGPFESGTGSYYIVVKDPNNNTNSTTPVTFTVKGNKKTEGSHSGFIPGFEAVSLLGMVGVCVILLRHRKFRRK